MRASPALPPAVVLAAGLGTRLRPLTWLRAKAALPLAGPTIVERILAWLAGSGVVEAVVNLHHRPESIAAVTGDGSAFGVRVRYSWEQTLLGSGGGLARAFRLVDADQLLVVNGDTLTDVDLSALLAAHRATGALVTMALVEQPEPGRYTGVRVDDGGVVRGFTQRGEPGGWHFVGVHVVSRDAFAGVSPDVPSESVSGHYRPLVARGAVQGWRTRAIFRDVGTPDVYLDTCFGLAPVRRHIEGRRVRVAPSASLDRTVLWDDITVEPAVELLECIVADGVTVPSGSRYHRSVIVRAADVPQGSGGRIDGELLLTPLSEFR
jgi:NDP-sugar pyrophosphorylase family protein